MNAEEKALAAALQQLPHGPEFRFLDRITALKPGVEGAGTYRVRGDEDFLAGHFPGAPLFPGVLLVEAAAQLAGVVAQAGESNPTGEQLRLTHIRAAKITGSAAPGEVLAIKAVIQGRLGNLVQAETEIRVGNRTLLTASVALSRGHPA